MTRSDLVAALTAAGLLPVADRPWREHERGLVEAGLELAGYGLVPKTIVQLARLGWRLAEIEVDAVVSGVSLAAEPGAALASQGEVHNAITRLSAAVRHVSVTRAMRRLAAIGDRFHEYSSDLLHVPSQLFVTRHGLNHVLAEVLARADESGADADHLLAGRLLIAFGRFAQASRRLDRVTAEPLAAEAAAHQAVCDAFLGRDGEARAAADRALALAPQSLRALVFGAVVRAFEAGRSDDPLEAATLVGQARELLGRSRAASSSGRVETIEGLLARGRVELLMPPAFGMHDQGVADLEQALALAEHDLVDLPAGATEIYRLHAFYFLGLVHAREGRPAAAVTALRQVVLLDPACRLTERAYGLLSELEAP